MQFLVVFADLTKITDCRWKNIDVNRTWEAIKAIFIIFGSFLDKV